MGFSDKLLALVLAAVTVSLAVHCGPVASAEIILDEDAAPLLPDLGRRYLGPSSDPAVQQPGAAVLTQTQELPGRPTRYEVVEVRVKRILNIRGNNPLDQADPVRNYDGQTLPTIDDLVAVLQNQSTAPPPVLGQACSGSSVPFGHGRIPGAGALVASFASIDLDPRSGSCALLGNSDGNALLLQTPASGPLNVPGNLPGDKFEAGSPFNGDWRLVDANAQLIATPGGRRIYHFSPNLPLTFRLQSQGTGVVVEIDLSVTGLPPDSFVLRVDEIRP